MVETTNEDSPPAPFNSTEFDAGSEETRVETVAAGAMLLEATDDDDAAPAPFNSVEFDSDNEEKTTATAAAGTMLLETIDDDDAAPAPFNSMEFEVHGAAPSKPNAMQRTNTVIEGSILVPVRENIRDQSAQFRTGAASNRVSLFPAGRAGMERDDGTWNRDIDIHTPPRNAVESRTHPMDNNLRVAGEEKEEVPGPDIVLEAEVERDVTIQIPEATLVVERDEEEVYIATPVEPATSIEPSVLWWKHRRAKFGEIIIILVAFSIAISQLMDKKDDPVAPVAAPAPLISMAPSSPLKLYTTTSPTSPALSSATCMMDMMNPECGATLDTWTGILGCGIVSLMSGTDNLAMAPDRRERLTSWLEAPSNIGDYYGSRMWGWLVPPVTADYTFWIASDDAGELWLSIDEHPAKKVLICAVFAFTDVEEWTKYAQQESAPIALVGGQAYYYEVLVKEVSQDDNLAIAWQYHGRALKVIQAWYSRTIRPGWPVTCAVDSDCDDGVWCNGVETCNAAEKVCQFGTLQACADGLSCTDDTCNELTKSCENPATDCSGSDDPCATGQCMESLGGCQFTCGATLDTWEGIIDGIYFSDLSVTNTLIKTPDTTERIGSLLEAPSIGDDFCSRMWGWLIPPVTGEYSFWIASGAAGELWLSINDDPANKARACYAPTSVWERDWYVYPEQQSALIPLVAGQAYYFEALVKKACGDDHLAIAWEYPGQTLEVVPVTYSRTTRPGLPVTCSVDSDCDDGVFCNGDETCGNDGVCMLGINQPCSDGLLCTDDICIESTKSCENPITDCLVSNYSCASDQCIESLGGCQFTCGATLDMWTDINGESIIDLMSGTDNLAKAPNKSERLGSLLEAEPFIGDNYGSRMWGWLVPPVTGNYTFWIASDDAGELWLSIDDDPANKVRACYAQWAVWYERDWHVYPEQQSALIPLVAGQAYYFEALMKERIGYDWFAIAWEYPGQTLEVIPAIHSRMAKPS